MKSAELVLSCLVFHLKQYEEPAEKVYMARFHISEPKLPTKISKALNVIIENNIQYDRNMPYSAEKPVLGQTIQNSF